MAHKTCVISEAMSLALAAGQRPNAEKVRVSVLEISSDFCRLKRRLLEMSARKFEEALLSTPDNFVYLTQWGYADSALVNLSLNLSDRVVMEFLTFICVD